MTNTGQTVALCMIVKNEAHVIERCLRSVMPLIDFWLIVDTGSDDGTQAIIQRILAGTKGELVERPWQNFGHNRSEALALASTMADYLLTLDADEFVRFDTGFHLAELVYDAYTFPVDSGGVLYTRIQLVRSTLPWRYEGVLHEYITADAPHTQATLPGVVTVRLLEGARSRDALTYKKDADLLEVALREEPNNTRYMFYLAQSYRDAHQPELALIRYRQRIAMGGFAEEVWCSLYESAKLLYKLGADWSVVKEAFLNAYRYRPFRAEPLYRIGVGLVQRKLYEEALLYLRQGMQLSIPTHEVLFVEADVYRFLLPLEYGVACFWMGEHHHAIATIDKLLSTSDLNAERRSLLLSNRENSLARLPTNDEGPELRCSTE